VLCGLHLLHTEGEEVC